MSCVYAGVTYTSPRSRTDSTCNLRLSVPEHEEYPALRVKRKGRWIEWTYRQYYDQSRAFAKALLSPAIDLPKHTGVAIIGFNSPEWFVADVGAIFAGCIATGMYTTNGPEACFYIADHCKVGWVVFVVLCLEQYLVQSVYSANTQVAFVFACAHACRLA